MRLSGEGRRRLASLAVALYGLALLGAPSLHLLLHRADHDHVGGAIRLRGLHLAASLHGHSHGAPGVHGAGAVGGPARPGAEGLVGATPRRAALDDAAPASSPGPTPAPHGQDSASHFALGLLPAGAAPVALSCARLPASLPPSEPPARPPGRSGLAPALARGPPRA